MDTGPSIRNKISRGKFRGGVSRLMSDGNRREQDQTLGDKFGVLAAIVLSSLLVGFIAPREGYQSEARQNRTYEYAQAAKRNAVIACRDREASTIADCVYDEISSAREQSKDEQDLDAQQWMVRWAAILTFISALTTIISWIALRYLRDTFRKTAEMAGRAREANAEMVRSNSIAHDTSRHRKKKTRLL